MEKCWKLFPASLSSRSFDLRERYIRIPISDNNFAFENRHCHDKNKQKLEIRKPSILGDPVLHCDKTLRTYENTREM